MIVESGSHRGLLRYDNYATWEDLVADTDWGWGYYLLSPKEFLEIKKAKSKLSNKALETEVREREERITSIKNALREADSISVVVLYSVSFPGVPCTINTYNGNDEMSRMDTCVGELVAAAQAPKDKTLGFVREIQMDRNDHGDWLRIEWGRDGVLQKFSDFFKKPILGIGQGYNQEYLPRLNRNH